MTNINIIAPAFDTIPDQLKCLNQWVMWRNEKHSSGKLTKRPFQPSGYPAIINKSETWCSFETAKRAFLTGGFSGIGFVLEGLTGIDIDGCIRGNEFAEWALEITRQFSDTYIELSPSRNGVHILCLGEPTKTAVLTNPSWGKDSRIEIYGSSSPRYFTVTGLKLNDTEGIRDKNEALRWLHEHYSTFSKQAKNYPIVDLEKVRKALQYVDVDSYESWIRAGMALKAAGLQLEIWDSWSQKSIKYKPGECQQKWNSFNPTDIGLGWLYKNATERGFDNAEVDAPAVISASALLEKKFANQQWVIDKLLPQGLAVLAGPPKIGKSFMALGIACAVASGNRVFESFDTTQGSVLYFALEDNERRLHKRLTSLVKNGFEKQIALQDLKLSCSIPRMDEGGVKALEDLIDKYPNLKLVVVDTWARFAADHKANRNSYDNDTRILGPLQTLAILKGIAIVCITHLRKAPSADPLGAVMGSTGLIGVPDSIWMLKRQRDEDSGSLTITGREIEEQELALSFDSETCTWRFDGFSGVKNNQMSAERQEVLAILANANEPIAPKTIAERLGKSSCNVKALLQKLYRSGEVERKAWGAYNINRNRSLRSPFNENP